LTWHDAQRTDAVAPACLDDHAVAMFADGTLDAASRAALIPHLADCSRCRRLTASVARALADQPIADERRPGRGLRTRRAVRLAAPLAAAAVLLVFLWPSGPDDSHRAPTITEAAAPTPRAPAGRVETAERLVWSSVGGADQYRVTLFDDAGSVLFATRATDTAAAIPDSVSLTAGRTYFWKTEARSGFDRWSASPLVEFTIARPARQE
jgi:hypothetical protein